MVVTPPSKLDTEPRPRGRVGDLLGRLALALLLIVFVAAGAWGLAALDRKPVVQPQAEFPVPFQSIEPGSDVPDAAGQVPQAGPAGPDASGPDPMDEWTRKVSEKTDIPRRALRAYALADLVMRAQAPSCRISWSTLAGVGRIESHHGFINGAKLGEDGMPSIPIVGIPLDGRPGVKAIGDTDGGRLDGDPTWDRAVGPMQFIPTTWVKYALRANGDGRAPDPQNIDDAALATARYLCSGSRDMGSSEGWWAAVYEYNNSVEYGQNVFSGADAYARASVTI
ncbi:lytic murein transglycosylase [Umezawaea sp. Da 62-37]|uniref:lytic transglycosylase domain-containing protein n=1 Tax=Umezawaea sp. Da 62-37 TaxID=3075927 RepID=UPI0028F6D43A|nr:lytic murein transglycosylase [Umezawaea sp. Da 62-37]WNV82288.1 lytic murein transglycosylase [Umezawaea sp. Da 62-37]